MTNRMSFKKEAAFAKIERIISLLQENPVTAHELAILVPISKRHVQEYLNHLVLERRVFIIRWARDVKHSERMYPRPIYAVGNRRNAPKPRPLDLDERKVRAWARLKADAERHTLHLLKKRRYRSDKKGPRRDKAASWINTTPANGEFKEAA